MKINSLDNESHEDVWQFFPTDADWHVFVKSILEDNSEQLENLHSTLSCHQWLQFLNSRDQQKKCVDCLGDYVSIDNQISHLPRHTNPTNPFLVAIAFKARNCLLYLKNSCAEFETTIIEEQGFNAYHLLVTGMHSDKNRYKLQKLLYCPKSFYYFFRTELFSFQDIEQMGRQINCFGMTPLEWGVYVGLPNVVEVLMYNSHPDFVKSSLIGLSEHLTVDLSVYTIPNERAFLSPLMILQDVYGDGDVSILKKLGIFRNNFIFQFWIDKLHGQNFTFSMFFFAENLIFFILLLHLVSPDPSQYLKDFQIGKVDQNDWKRLNFLLGVLIYGIVSKTILIFLAIVVTLTGKSNRNNSKYPSKTWNSMKYVLSWNIPFALNGCICIILISLYTCTKFYIDNIGNFVYVFNSILFIFVITLQLYGLFNFFRMFSVTSRFVTSLQNSFNTFFIFLTCYISIIAIFGRLFASSQNARIIFPPVSHNCTNSESYGSHILREIYTTFTLSLNVLNPEAFASCENNLDILIIHFLYVLIVPVFFINFIIGVVSSVVGEVFENDIEYDYFFRMRAALYIEQFYCIFRILFKKMCSKQKVIWKFTICKPHNVSGVFRPMSLTCKETRG